jgi:hypothetical protein
LRTDFLIHWTGKDIERNRSNLREAHRDAYVDRLINILHEGFWMTIPDEKIIGNNNSWIEYKAPMTCFTEVRLSETQEHAKRYGLLGVGVSRKFVLDRFGGPVHYVRNDTFECIIGNVNQILNFLQKSEQNELVNYFAINSAFLKNMSSDVKDDFTFLNEQEWRIVHTHKQTDLERIFETDVQQPKYKISLQPNDIRIIVFPDDQTRIKARKDPRLTNWLQDPTTSNAVLLTIEECEHL